MPRQRRPASLSSSWERATPPRVAPAPSRVAPAPVRQTQPGPATAHPPAPMGAAPQQPSLFGQMAATAGGVAVGSAIGHTVGHAVTGMFSGGGSDHEVAPAAAAPAQQMAPGHPEQQNTTACAWEVIQFLKCAQQQDDLSLCSGFNEALRQCREMNPIFDGEYRMFKA